MKRRFSILIIHMIGATWCDADTKFWTPTSGSNWSAAVNWTPTGAPTVGDDVLLTNPVQCVIDQSIDVNSLVLTNSFGNTNTLTFAHTGPHTISNIYKQIQGKVNWSNATVTIHGALIEYTGSGQNIGGTSTIYIPNDCLITNGSAASDFLLGAFLECAYSNKTVTFRPGSLANFVPLTIKTRLHVRGGTLTWGSLVSGPALRVAAQTTATSLSPTQHQLLDADEGSILQGGALQLRQGFGAVTQDLSVVNADFRCALYITSGDGSPVHVPSVAVILLTNRTLTVTNSFQWGPFDNTPPGNKLVVVNGTLSASVLVTVVPTGNHTDLYASNAVLIARAASGNTIRCISISNQWTLIDSRVESKNFSAEWGNSMIWTAINSQVICSNYTSIQALGFGTGGSKYWSNSSLVIAGSQTYTLTSGNSSFDTVRVNGSCSLVDGLSANTIIANGTFSAAGNPITAGVFQVDSGIVGLSNTTTRILQDFLLNAGTVNTAASTLVIGSSGTTSVVTLTNFFNLTINTPDSIVELSTNRRVTVAGTLSVSSTSLNIRGGTNNVMTAVTIGLPNCSAPGTLTVTGGRLSVTNTTSTAVCDILAGTLQLDGGTLTLDKLVITNACAHFLRTGGTLILNTPAILGPDLDADGDGLPNGWEQQYGFNPLSGVGASEAGDDPDGDGLTNLQEFQAGTNPTSGASYFGIMSITQSSTNMLITWQTGINKTNALERTGGASGNFSNDFATVFTVTNTVATTTNYLDVGAAPNMPGLYYRIRLVP